MSLVRIFRPSYYVDYREPSKAFPIFDFFILMTYLREWNSEDISELGSYSTKSFSFAFSVDVMFLKREVP